MVSSTLVEEEIVVENNSNGTTDEEILLGSNSDANITLGDNDDPLKPRFNVYIYYEDGSSLVVPASLYGVDTIEGFVSRRSGNRDYVDRFFFRFNDKNLSLTSVLPYVHKSTPIVKIEVYATNLANAATDIDSNEILDTTAPIYSDEGYWNGMGDLTSYTGAHFEIVEYQVNLVHFI